MGGVDLKGARLDLGDGRQGGRGASSRPLPQVAGRDGQRGVTLAAPAIAEKPLSPGGHRDQFVFRALVTEMS